MNVAQVLPKCKNDDVTILFWRKKKHWVLRTALSVSERGDVFRILLYIFYLGPGIDPQSRGSITRGQNPGPRPKKCDVFAVSIINKP